MSPSRLHSAALALALLMAGCGATEEPSTEATSEATSATETAGAEAAPSGPSGCDCCNWGVSGTERPPDPTLVGSEDDAVPASCRCEGPPGSLSPHCQDGNWCAMHCPTPM